MIYGVADVDPVARDTARSFGLTPPRAAAHLVLPTALPYLMTGLRLAAAVALILAITAEMVIGNPGLGRMIELSRSAGDAAGLYALVVVTGLLGRRGEPRLPVRRTPDAALAPVRPRGGGPVTAYPGRIAAAPRRRGVGARSRRPCGTRSGCRCCSLVVWAPGGDPGRRSRFFPGPVTDRRAFVDTWFGPAFVEDVLPSLGRLGLGVAASIVLGIAAGTVIGLTAVAARAARTDARVLPRRPAAGADPGADAPARHHRHDEGRRHRLRRVWPILLNTIEGVRATDSVHDRDRALVPDHRWERLWFLMLPGRQPADHGRRPAGLSVALILMVISEMFASSSGLGYRIVYFQRNYLIAEMWSGIVLLGLIGVLLAVVFGFVERRVLRWYHGMREVDRG